MNKLKTLLASAFIATLSFTAVNSVEFRGGVTGQSAIFAATAFETQKDFGQTRSTDGFAALNYLSIFGEVAMESMYGISVGIEYTPDSIDLENADRIINGSVNDGTIGGALQAGRDVGVAATEEAGGDTPGGIQVIDAKITELSLIYLGIPLMDTGLVAKVGYQQATMVTQETLATGASYKDAEMEGYSIGLYYDREITSNVFVRLESSYSVFDEFTLISPTGTKIGAEIGGIAGKASVGFKF
tara:strand:+ start:728 stop:1456 length:729 start_codon:yes stop_codon:yes gene_type:complete